MTSKFQTPKQNQPLKHKSFANTNLLSTNFHKYHQPSNKPKTLQFQIKKKKKIYIYIYIFQTTGIHHNITLEPMFKAHSKPKTEYNNYNLRFKTLT